MNSDSGWNYRSLQLGKWSGFISNYTIWFLCNKPTAIENKAKLYQKLFWPWQFTAIHTLSPKQKFSTTNTNIYIYWKNVWFSYTVLRPTYTFSRSSSKHFDYTAWDSKETKETFKYNSVGIGQEQNFPSIAIFFLNVSSFFYAKNIQNRSPVAVRWSSNPEFNICVNSRRRANLCKYSLLHL